MIEDLMSAEFESEKKLFAHVESEKLKEGNIVDSIKTIE